MYYATKTSAGTAKFSPIKPEEGVFYVEVLKLPNGVMRFDKNNKLYLDGYAASLTSAPSLDERVDELEKAFDALTEGLI